MNQHSSTLTKGYIDLCPTEVARLQTYLESADSIVLLPHTAPDGDALGCTLGLMQMLRLAYPSKRISVISPDPIEQYLAWLPLLGELCIWGGQELGACELIAEADLLIYMDHNQLKRLRHTPLIDAVRESKASRVMIDHHLDPEQGLDLYFSYPGTSSTCELTYRIAAALGLTNYLSVQGATLLLTGMITDTGRFMYGCFAHEVFDTVAKLLSHGAQYAYIVDQLSYHNPLPQLLLQGYILHEKLVLMPELRAAYFELTQAEMQERGISKGDTEGLVNLPLSVEGIDSVCFLREDKDQIKLSLRSIGDFPVNELASRGFGGGGHLNAAGAEHHGTLDEAKNVYLCTLKEIISEHIQKKQ